MALTLLASPLQGFTDHIFRQEFNKHFGGIDVFYAPYIKLQRKQEVKNANRRDLLPENNDGIKLIPQVMANTANDFLFVANYVAKMGYKELNWNLGCPYPMVTKQNLGSGLIGQTERIAELLTEVFANTELSISIKTRLGYENAQELFKLLPVLDSFPIDHIAIHPRLGKQLYKGLADRAAFAECLNLSKHTLFYNGDIDSVGRFAELQAQFPHLQNWMLGRSVLMDPFLPAMIKSGETSYPADKLKKLALFHADLVEQYSASLSGPGHLLNKMQQFWDYFEQWNPEKSKTVKKVKKVKTMNNYLAVVQDIFAG